MTPEATQQKESSPPKTMATTKPSSLKRRSLSKHKDERSDTEKYNFLVSSVNDAVLAAKSQGKRSVFSYAIQDLMESTTTTNYDVTLAWDQLLKAIENEDRVFSEYFGMLELIYEQTTDEPSPVPHHLYTLLKLLKQSVECHKSDPSITCRFVTLLEILHSYSPSWNKPSAALEAFWMRLTQRVPAKVTPIGFRRKAYRVLVSLSWVPSTKGLLEACSFDEQKDLGVGTFTSLDIVRPRWDILNQLLDRLKDETDVCVGITSRQPGVGKTTLAAQVATHPSIRRVFKVVWLDVSGPLTYDQYYTHLQDILLQVGVHGDIEETVTRRLEEPALIRLREQRSMKLLKKQVTSYLENTIFLLVLDQVDSPDKVIPWFRFHSRQSIIVTTTSCTEGADNSLLDWSLELDDTWSIDEAVDLLLHEADLPKQFGYSSDLRDMCKNARPLTIRVLARWLRLKKVSVGLFQAVNEISIVLKALGSKNHPLFDILSLMMGPKSKGGKSMTVLFLLCFSSFCTVFPNDGAPLEAVLMLWEEILSIEPLAANEMSRTTHDSKKYARWIAEGLFHMGVISIRNKSSKTKPKVAWVEAHHRFYREFAVIMAREMDLRPTFAETIIDWNSAFVTGYFAQKAHLKDCLEYSVENLQSHMLYANLISRAADVLSEKEFFDLRVKTLGWDKAMKMQIQDCINIQDCLKPGDSTGSLVFQATSSLFRGRSSALESSKALYSLALALAQNGYYAEAISQFEAAGSLPQNKKQKVSIRYGVAWSMWSSDVSARTKLNECRGLMEEDTIEHELHNDMLILSADVLVGDCEYQKASDHFETILEKFRADPEFNPIELGVTLYKYGRLLYLTGNIDRAKKTLEECIKWKRDNEEISRSLCDALGLLGDLQQEMGQPNEAKENFEAALQTLDCLDCDESHLDYRLLAAKVQLLRNDVQSSIRSFELVRKTSVASPLRLHDQSAYDLRSIARAYEECDRVSDSLAVLRESLSLTSDRPDSLERAAGKVALGNCLILLDDEEEALECYHEAQTIQRRKLGDSSFVVIDTDNMIGHALLALGKYDEAIQLFESNYEKTKQVDANDVERLAGVLYLAADAYEAKGQYSDAAWNFNQCLGYLKRDRATDHPDIAKTLQRLADTTGAQGDIDMAYGYYSHAVNIRRKHNDLEMLAEALFGFGKLAKRRREYDVAHNTLIECLTLQKSLDGETDGLSMELGHVYSLSSKFDVAMSTYHSAEEHSAAKLFIAHVRLAQGELTSALQDYEAMEASPEVILGRRIAMFLMGNDDQVKYDIETLNASPSGSSWVAISSLLEGDALEFNGSAEEAKLAWKQASNWTFLSELTQRRLNGGTGFLVGLDAVTKEKESTLLRTSLLLESARVYREDDE